METSQLIWRANKLARFYMTGTLGIKELTVVLLILLVKSYGGVQNN